LFSGGKEIIFCNNLMMEHSSNDYEKIKTAIAFISEQWRDQPSLDRIAAELSLSPQQMYQLFIRWAGLSPKSFLQAVTFEKAKKLLDAGYTILDTAYELGLSGPGRLHDLFVNHEGMSPGIYKSKGEGSVFHYGYHQTIFGLALIIIHENYLISLAFCDDETSNSKQARLIEMMKRWPNAAYQEKPNLTQPYIDRIFCAENWHPSDPLQIKLIGSDFEVRVWNALLKVPMGAVSTYSAIANQIGQPNSQRAVGKAIGRNPLAFVVPCHRIVAKSGNLTGYHWSLTRKRAILGWEIGQTYKDLK
jgi:AraC family transcriptional regulator, regulatory protein of adaptative response / methylated-DNA-[protein]-cysteine methyltransferase